MKQCGIIRLWALRAKFNDALEMMSEPEPLMSRLKSMLEDSRGQKESDVQGDPCSRFPY